MLKIVFENTQSTVFKKSLKNIGIIIYSSLTTFCFFVFFGGAVMPFDRSENAMLSSLEKGAYFYFTNPLYMEDMSDIWQYVHTRRHQ